MAPLVKFGVHARARARRDVHVVQVWRKALHARMAALLLGWLGLSLITLSPNLSAAPADNLDGRLLACGDEPPPALTGRFAHAADGQAPDPEKLAAMGRKIFFDPSLSASGRQACASCHVPSHGYGPANALSVQLGGPGLKDQGTRSAPSLSYMHAPPAFALHHVDPDDRPVIDAPVGGRTWDGRVNLARDQALMPLLDPKEMANKNIGEVVARLRRATYAREFDALFSAPGTHILNDEEGAAAWMTVALEYFEQSPEDFHPFTSKYDFYLRGRVQLSEAEIRGVRLFTNRDKGNCASCHPVNRISPTVLFPRFTDFQFSALGVPRNMAIAANKDPAFFDLGLCGPARKDLQGNAPFCGMFRAPTLRNVGLRQSFFHNGVFHSLREVMDFYATRDSDPAHWYGRQSDGKPNAYNDLPAAYHANVRHGAPFDPLPDGRPRLTEQDREDLVAFLKTLSDGFVPPPEHLLMLPDKTAEAHH